MMNQSVKEIWL